MIPTLWFLIFVIMISSITCTANISYIYNASYVSNDIEAVITYRYTCSECICNAFFSNISTEYMGLNCYKNNKTCALFANYSLPLAVRINLDSTFIFIPQLSSQNTTISYPLAGVTVAGYSNGTSGTALNALNSPWGLAIDANDTLYISDSGNSRVIQLPAGYLNGSIVAGNGSSGSSLSQLGGPTELKIDANSNVYVDDNAHCRAVLWRKNASTGVLIAGNGNCNGTASTIGTSIGLTRDSQGNIYVSDRDYHRVMKWAPNATSGILVAGVTGVAGTSNQQLNSPYGLYLDENNSYLYIADMGNNRIQRYSLGNATNGITVAGGNGQGSSSNQLNQPHGVYVSKKTGDIYIADRPNNRIQRWSSGASSGVTVVGVTGMTDTNATMLNSPVGVIMNINETFLYVSDRGNNRVQRYPLT